MRKKCRTNNLTVSAKRRRYILKVFEKCFRMVFHGGFTDYPPLMVEKW